MFSADRSFENVAGTVEMFGNDSNESKFCSGGNYEESEFGYCLLPFSPEPFVFSSAV
jgi:hypothetical protein